MTEGGRNSKLGRLPVRIVELAHLIQDELNLPEEEQLSFKRLDQTIGSWLGEARKRSMNRRHAKIMRFQQQAEMENVI